MGLESPDRISEEVNDLPNEAKPAFVGKLDLNLAVSREEAVEGYGHENEASGNKSQVDLNHQGQHGSPSLPTDVRLEEPESPCTNSRLPLKTELDLAEVSTRNIAYDQERSPSLPSSRDKRYHEEREVVSGSSNKSSSPI
nr:TPA_asm: hypothetical protein HUJ06_001860 [Nelumbo nucifera]